MFKSNYDRAKKVVKDYPPRQTKEEQYQHGAILASLAVADEIRALREAIEAQTKNGGSNADKQ